MPLVTPVIRRSITLLLYFDIVNAIFSDNAIYDFSKRAVENGLDIFRVFDSLNYIENVCWLFLTQFLTKCSLDEAWH